MSKLSRILVPVDFSPASTGALALAAAIAARTGAELHALHVQVFHRDMYGWGRIPDIEAVEKIIADQSRQDLEQAVQGIGPPVVHEVMRDVKASPAIVRYAKEHNIDLIVMGTHARTGVSRMFMGSAAAAVLRESPVAVMAIGAGHEPPADGYRRILVALDFSEAAGAALQQASAIAGQHKAELIALHVVEPRVPTPYDRMFETTGEVRARAVASLDELLDQANLPTPPGQRLVAVGSPDDEIVVCAREEAVDLIVMGVVGRSGLSRVLLGSTTERVLRNAPCAVLAHRGQVYQDM